MADLSILNINDENNFITSLNPSDIQSKKKLYNCINSPDEGLSDALNKTINMVDYIAHNVEVENDKGDKVKAVRLILIDDKGKSYASVSDGAVQALAKIFSIFGTPDTWEEPLKIKAVEKKSRKFKFMTFEVL